MASPRNMKAKRDKVKMEEENIRRFFLSFSLSLSLLGAFLGTDIRDLPHLSEKQKVVTDFVLK